MTTQSTTYVIKNKANGQYFCADWILGERFYANVEWSTDASRGLKFDTKEYAKGTLAADVFPSTCIVIAMPKYFLITNYENYRGRINCLQVTRVCEGAAGWTYVKRFTSLKNMAATRAKSWAKKKNIELVSY